MTWGDKGREGVKKLEFWGDVIYGWSLMLFHFQLSGLDRGRILTNAARIIRENVEELSQNEVLDNGKPIWEAR